MRALIMEDGLSRQALAASRALRAAGWTVGVGCASARGITAWSRSSSFRHHAPLPQLDPDGFVRAVNDAIDEVGYELVFGARDADVLVLSSRRDEIGATVPYAPHPVLLRLLDKLELDRAARATGVASPRTLEATDEVVAATPLPVVVKARLHAGTEGGEQPARLDTHVAHDRATVERLVEAIRSAGGTPILQERLEGPLTAVSIVTDRDGHILGSVQQQAERVYPRGAGVSVRARTVPGDGRLLQGLSDLVSELGWWGLAEAQFIVPPGGLPRLVDFNSRFYGSLALAVGAGVNLPALWAATASGRSLPPRTAAVPGMRYQWLAGDLRRSLADGWGGGLWGALSSLAYAPGAVQSVFSWRDPLPALCNSGVTLKRLL